MLKYLLDKLYLSNIKKLVKDIKNIIKKINTKFLIIEEEFRFYIK